MRRAEHRKQPARSGAAKSLAEEANQQADGYALLIETSIARQKNFRNRPPANATELHVSPLGN